MFVCLACCLSYGMTVCLSVCEHLRNLQPRIIKSEHNIVLYYNNEHIAEKCDIGTIRPSSRSQHDYFPFTSMQTVM